MRIGRTFAANSVAASAIVAIINHVAGVIVQATDDVAVETLTLTVTDPGSNTFQVSLDAFGRGTFPVTAPGVYTLVATATDAAGNSRSNAPAMVQGIADPNPPLVWLALSNGQRLTDPVQLVGTVDDRENDALPVQDQQIRYTVTLEPVGGAVSAILIAGGP